MRNDVEIITNVKLSIKDYMNHFGISSATAVRYRRQDRNWITDMLGKPSPVRLFHFFLIYEEIPCHLKGCVKIDQNRSN